MTIGILTALLLILGCARNSGSDTTAINKENITLAYYYFDG
jgi:hypothetical protein